MKINNISGSVLKIDLSTKETSETKLGSIPIVPRTIQSQYTAKARLVKTPNNEKDIVEILLSPREGANLKLKLAKANVKYYLDNLEGLKDYEFKIVDALPLEDINKTETTDANSANLTRTAPQANKLAANKTA